MKFSKEPKAILIDLDGTLVDSVESLYLVYLKFLKSFGVMGNRDEFYSLNGPSLHEIIAALKRKYGWKETERELFEKYIQMIQGLYESAPLFPGTKEFLEYAKSRGTRLAVVTSVTREPALRILERPGILPYFELVMTSDGLLKSKPDPEIYQICLDQLKLHPSDTWAVEDAYHGVKAAVSASIPTVLITHGRPLHFPKPPFCLQVESWDKLLGFWKGL